MILVVDNYDSFTFNLVQCLGTLGADPVVVRCDAIDLPALEASPPSGIVISPGPCTPNEAGLSVEVVRRWSGRVPLLGVCLGHQCIAQAFGARVDRRLPVVHGKTSRVRHDGLTPFEGLPDPLEVARYHSLVVEPSSLPEPLVAAAWTEDDAVLMAMRHRTHATYGIQFHPESYLTPSGPRIVANFLRRIPCPTSPTV